MKVAICGYPPLAVQIINGSKNSGLEFTHFVSDFISSHGEENFNLPPNIQLVSFFEFRRLTAAAEVEGLIIAEMFSFQFSLNVVKTCSFYGISNVGVINFDNPVNTIYWLDSDKAYLPYMETNLIDSCNLNCKSCDHFANIFSDKDFYSLQDFKRDVRQMSENINLIKFRLMGGEPLKLKNLDRYITIARNFFPKTDLRIVTNGLLIPNTPQYIFDALRENNFSVDISMYPPTIKMLDKIENTLRENNIYYKFDNRDKIEYFNAFITLHSGHDPAQSTRSCHSSGCKFLRDGKLYKCAADAFSFRLAERFGLKDFPASTGVDIFAKNFTSQLEQLFGFVELCHWCNETARLVPWQPENNPKLTDWLANPSEAENLLT